MVWYTALSTTSIGPGLRTQRLRKNLVQHFDHCSSSALISEAAWNRCVRVDRVASVVPRSHGVSRAQVRPCPTSMRMINTLSSTNIALSKQASSSPRIRAVNRRLAEKCLGNHTAHTFARGHYCRHICTHVKAYSSCTILLHFCRLTTRCACIIMRRSSGSMSIFSLMHKELYAFTKSR